MEHITIKIPKAMFDDIADYIADHPEDGYTCVTDFLKEHGRLGLERKLEMKRLRK